MSSVIDSKTTLVALQGLKSANVDASRAAERLATGLRINRASDDPAGLVKATKLNAEISSYSQVKRNINTALSQMGEVTTGVSTMLERLTDMRVIATSALNETDATKLAAYQDQFDELVTSIDDVAGEVEFGNSTVLNGGDSIDIQFGIDSGDSKTLVFSDATTGELGVDSLNLTTGAGAAVTAIDAAITKLGGNLAIYGGYEKSLEGYSDIADAAILSKSSTYGEIMNADLALEASNLAAAKIRQDTATAVLAQANSMNRNIADYLLNGILG